MGIKATLGVDVSAEDTLFVKSEVEVLRAPSYQIQQTRMPNHPGQIKVSVYDRVQEELVEFQLLADLVSDGRFYCNFSAGDMTPQKAEQEAPKSGVNTEWHMEFLDLVEEGGMVYRHFRMMPDESFLTWMGAKSPSARPSFGDLFFSCSPLLAFRAGSTNTKHYISSSTPRSHSSSSFAPPEPRGSRDRKSLLWLSVGLRRTLACFVPARAMTDQRYSLRLGALVRLSSQAFSLVVSWLATCSCIFHQLLP